MTFNYSHEMDDIEAMLIDAKNDGREEGLEQGLERGLEQGHDDVLSVLRDVGISANQIAEVRTRLAVLGNHETKF